MGNEIDIDVHANETVSDTLGNVQDSTKRTEKVIVSSMATTEAAFDSAARESSKLGSALDTAEGATSKLGDGAAGVSDSISALTDIMNHSADKAQALKRAQNDVDQATVDLTQSVEDLEQAHRDGAQAEIDMVQADQDAEQSLLDKKKAQDDYNKAVKEHGKNSTEARQAMLDLNQADIDHKQALEDSEQAQRDATQAGIDAKQATVDQNSANLDLVESQKEVANQNSIMGKVSDWAGILSTALGGLAGVIGLITTIQWAWNIAMTANPIGLVIAGVAALIAIIVIIAMKTDWFQKLWKATWEYVVRPVIIAAKQIGSVISSMVSSIGKMLKKIPDVTKAAFKGLANVITAPFRAAFGAIRSAWNSTVGGFGFSVPDWIPGVGGKSFSVPYMASGGDVLKSGLAYIHQGERVMSAAGTQRLNHADTYPTSGSGMGNVNIVLEFKTSDSGGHLEAAMVDMLKNNVRVKAVVNSGIRDHVKGSGNGNVQVAYGR